VLFAVYAATLGVGPRRTGDEAHRLVGAASVTRGEWTDLSGAYRARVWEAWDGPPVRPAGAVVSGRRVEPGGIGFSLLIAPAYALGGATAVELFLAGLAALAFVLAAALARRVVPDPWATWAAVLAALSPPALAQATAVAPALAAGLLLVAAALCALRVRERPLMRNAFGGGLALALLPWLDPWLLIPAAPVAFLLARWTARRGRTVVALGSLEIQLASLVFYVSLNERLYGGFTPLAVADQPATGTSSLAGYAERLPRLAGAGLEREAGLLRWAPVVALALLGAWLLWRSRRVRLAKLVAEQRDAEHAAFLALAVCAAQLVAAAFTTPSLAGLGAGLVPALPCAVAPMAWGLRHAPVAGWVLGALTLVSSVWLVAEGSWSPSSEAPWGPLVGAFPVDGTVGATVWAVVAALLVAVAVAAGLRRRRGAFALRH
jgi:hypothetical protein